MSIRFGIDVGGTFTDVVVQDQHSGETHFVKVDSTPRDQSVGILNGIQAAIERFGLDFKDTSQLIHGTTVATNAVLEHKGGKTVLFTTEGFGDILEVARQIRPKLYDSWARKPEPLIPRHLIFEVPERITHDGQILKELDAEAAERLMEETSDDIQTDAVVISFLHSYKNPLHEQKIKALAERHFPNTPVFTSHEVHPLIREFERTSTVVINAYITPKIKWYLSRLVSGLKGMEFNKDFYVMQANGGMISTNTAETKGMYTILSGPAAGVLGAGRIGQLAGYNNVITLDMGGTSADVALINEGEKEIVSSTEIGGHPLSVSTININAVGAGGGSIAWIDHGGTLRVGPQSAGSDPGPVCYDRGGMDPTVTDANLVVGVIDPNNFLGGEKKLNCQLAYRTIEERLAKPLGMSVEEVASGIIRVANACMVRAIRVISVEGGHDPREFALVAFGGAGPMHAAAVAEELNIPKVIASFAPGILSAYGCLVADVRMDYARTYIKSLKDLDLEEMKGLYGSMAQEGLDLMEKEKIEKDKISLLRSVDMKYAGQAYELSVPFPEGRIDRQTVEQMAERFHQSHERAYGYAIKSEPIEVINLRLTAVGQVAQKGMEKKAESGYRKSDTVEVARQRKVYFKDTWHTSAIYQKEDLWVGDEFSGPAIVEGRDSTIVIHPGQKAVVDEYANIIIDAR